MSFRSRVISPLLRSKVFQWVFYSPLLDYHQYCLVRFVRRVSSLIKRGERIIDVGAGELKYRHYFGHCDYVSNDLGVGDAEWVYRNIDIVSPADRIPVEAACFDHVLCTQVMEHIEYPEMAFKEFQRILKPGGMLYLTAPLCAVEHQPPFDYFRYTRYGLDSLGRRSGFELIFIEPHGGVFVNLDVMFWCAFWSVVPFRRFSYGRYLLYFIVLPAKVATGVVALILDFFDYKKNYTINYNVIYRKLPD